MKNLLLVTTLFLFFAGITLAQDTTKAQVQEKKQTQTQTQNRFIDLDGDGINDAVMEQWRKMIRTQDGQGEMNQEQNREQNRIHTGEPLGPKGNSEKGSTNDPTKSKSKGDKGKK